MRVAWGVAIALAVTALVSVAVYVIVVAPDEGVPTSEPPAGPTRDAEYVPQGPSPSEQVLPNIDLTVAPSPVGTPVTFSDLAIGTCLLSPYTHITGDDREPLARLEAVPCADSHFEEVYVLGHIANGDYPGDEPLVAQVQATCVAEYPDYVGKDYASSAYSIDMFYPTEASWAADDRAFACLAYSDNGIEGSVAGVGR